MNDKTYLMPDEPTRFTPLFMDKMLEHTERLNASDITIQTGEPIYAEVYGKLLRITNRRLSNTELGDLINAIYGPNATTQLLSGKDIDTHYEFRPNRGVRYRYRVNATACLVEGHDAIQITLRTIPTTPPRLETMNLPDNVLEAIAPQEGIVFITGATGSGKSTLLASIIRNLIETEDSNRKVLTYESPIEFVYDEIETISAVVSQSEIPRHLPSFADGVRNALRRKPRLIMVGECRDAETISAALEAALTGHPVYTTLHTSGVAETMRRLVTSFSGEERLGRTIDILETIRLCIWQKLVPTVDEKRVALREYLVFDEEVRDILLESDPNDVTSATRKLVRQKGQLMTWDAKAKFEQGIISERVYKLIIAGAKEYQQ
ncbi:Dot/Icm type IV secretion system ATPase DotB [Fluoribacter dumoffii]|uniref:Type II secretory pathway, ATPase PulE/Tfp pilus assembly pathway, ATPase PilB n=1 Tax=Fluoribacter dumoffii TaxID=463 RepID=A0A377G620_9GAMM|nr:Dot/Icm type IV secretion system ATPase DotB [Fluoribacter dumoffii]KTC92513.1 DotB [Fluoribacter dumoffii NY 23]MCW8387089.1 Dot/Icm type IV secretion system ATPase DotB [Fluoribacter dumoffii]MCW8417407.1 Dot/Icm type IV secretion system ATPase DotB [Fluoribacter dumoffii]MCW8454752.1 Dot/Icm type IV secretion system ATPase DotB [Fluoribacter dumoffii]MCW8461171.1 Dot/Icm type IV secretion system ATPase DotB [Fluoribacter dumoffii]